MNNNKKNTLLGIGRVGPDDTKVESITGKFRAIKKYNQNKLCETVMAECFRQAQVALFEGRKEDCIYWLNRASEVNRKRMSKHEIEIANA